MSEYVFTDGLEAVADARTNEDLLRHLLALGEGHGYHSGSINVIYDNLAAQAGSASYSVDAYSAAYTEEIYAEPSAIAVDPVMNQLRTSLRPIWWDATNYLVAGCADQYDRMSRHEMRAGIVFALHLPNSLHVLAGLETASAQRSPADKQAIASDLCLWLSVAAKTALDLAAAHGFNPAPPGSSDAERAELEPVLLAPRQVDVLRCVAKSGSAKAVARQLSLSERTVNAYLHAAYERLGVKHKAAAVHKAQLLGLL